MTGAFLAAGFLTAAFLAAAGLLALLAFGAFALRLSREILPSLVVGIVLRMASGFTEAPGREMSGAPVAPDSLLRRASELLSDFLTGSLVFPSPSRFVEILSRASLVRLSSVSYTHLRAHETS